jgi:hypothetical protein
MVNLNINNLIMSTITINKIPDKINFKSNIIDFDVFIETISEYMNDLEDIEFVKNEMKNNNETFDYNFIRKNYV